MTIYDQSADALVRPEGWTADARDRTTVDFDMVAPSIKVARMSNIRLCACTTVIHVLSSTVDTEAE
jgi:hypothetical protein